MTNKNNNITILCTVCGVRVRVFCDYIVIFQHGSMEDNFNRDPNKQLTIRMRVRIGFNVQFRYLHTKTEYIQPDCHYFKMIMNDLPKLNTTNIYVNNFNLISDTRVYHQF